MSFVPLCRVGVLLRDLGDLSRRVLFLCNSVELSADRRQNMTCCVESRLLDAKSDSPTDAEESFLVIPKPHVPLEQR